MDVLGAIYLDAGIEKIDEVLTSLLFPDDKVNHWFEYTWFIQ